MLPCGLTDLVKKMTLAVDMQRLYREGFSCINHTEISCWLCNVPIAGMRSCEMNIL